MDASPVPCHLAVTDGDDLSNALVVTSGARLVAETVRRSLALLRCLDRPTIGNVENMASATAPSSATLGLSAEFTAPVLADRDTWASSRVDTATAIRHNTGGRPPIPRSVPGS